MNKNPESKQFWRLAGPILLFWVIEFAARFLIEAVVLAPRIVEILGYRIFSGGMTQDDIMNLVMENWDKIAGILQQYQIEILGGVALFTVPLTLTLFLMDRKREKTLLLPQNKKAGIWSYSAILVFGAAVCIGMSCLSIMTNLALMSDNYQIASAAFYSASVPVQVIVLGIIIPLTEELMFRGVLFKRYREQSSFLRAALYSSLLFSITHSNMVQLLYSFVLGMFLAYVYEKYGSFKAPAVLHITANIISVILTNTGGFTWLAANPVRMGIASIASAFIGSVMFVFIQKTDEKPVQ